MSWSLALVDYHENLIFSEAMSAEPPPSKIHQRLRSQIVVVEKGIQLRMRYFLPVQAEIGYHGKTALETLYDPLRSVQGLTRT